MDEKISVASNAAKFIFIETEAEFLETKLRGRAIIV
jgi:hypothetical protein